MVAFSNSLRIHLLFHVAYKTLTEDKACPGKPWESTIGISPTLEWMVSSPPASILLKESIYRKEINLATISDDESLPLSVDLLSLDLLLFSLKGNRKGIFY